MSVFSIPPLASSILFLLLGVFIFLNNIRSRVNQVFFAVCFATAWWQLSWFILFLFNDIALAHYLVRIGYMGIIMIPVLFFHFFIKFLGHVSKFDRLFLWVLYLAALFFEVSLFVSDWFISGFYRYFWGFYPRAGFLHPAYLFVLILALCRIIYLLFINLKDRNINLSRHQQIKYLFCAIVFYALAGSDFLVNYGVEFYPFGFLCIIVFILFVAYAIIKSQFLDVKVIATEMFAVFLVVVSFIEMFYFNSLSGFIFRISIFGFSLFFSILLIRSVLREVRRREEMENMAKELKEASKSLSIANKKLKKLDEAKSEFLSIASHQLRTPSTVIKGYVSMMLEGSFGKIPKKIKENLTKVYSANERLLNLIENLLNISRIEAGRLDFEVKPVDMVALVQEVVDDFLPKAKEKKIALEFKPDKDLPKASTDRAKAKEVISNIIDNAIKYTPKGEIIVGLHQESRSIVFSSQDTGMGVLPEDLPRLFDKFIRGQGMMKVHTEGTGLGLYYARMLVENLGGRIWAESAGQGKGSKFSFSLPLANKSKAKKVK